MMVSAVGGHEHGRGNRRGPALSADAPLGSASADLALAKPTPPKSEGTDLSLGDMGRAALRAQFEAHRGSRAALARKLGISERSLYRKLRALGEGPPAR